jgi:mono/diheme cytochrome c family protein
MKIKDLSSLLLFPALLLAGCRATVPSPTETRAIYWTKHHLTVGGKKDINPEKPTADNIADGKDLFTSYCMVCHGLDGQNTGVPPVPSLASADVQAYTDGQLKWIIENGISPSGMPPSKGDFSTEEIWHMVLYIRHLPKAGSLGTPPVYGGSAK